jgi:hypothetical protein
MAFFQYCLTCQKNTAHYNTLCLECAEKQFQQEKLNSLEELKTLPIEERVARIETTLYELVHRPNLLP